MRDPTRIDKFCAELAELWHKAPDMRFGQFMSNVLGEVYSSTNKDIFYIEDESMMEYIKDISWLKD